MVLALLGRSRFPLMGPIEEEIRDASTPLEECCVSLNSSAEHASVGRMSVPVFATSSSGSTRDRPLELAAQSLAYATSFPL